MTQILTPLDSETPRGEIPSWHKRPIGPGDTGPDVRIVLRKLGLPPDEPFGEMAVTRIKGIARMLGVYDHDGTVDSAIAAVLGEAEITKAGGMPAWFCIRLGDFGSQVAAAASLLGMTSSEFTPEMDSAVRRFQSSQRMNVTGVIDAETARALGEL